MVGPGFHILSGRGWGGGLLRGSKSFSQIVHSVSLRLRVEWPFNQTTPEKKVMLEFWGKSITGENEMALTAQKPGLEQESQASVWFHEPLTFPLQKCRISLFMVN